MVFSRIVLGATVLVALGSLWAPAWAQDDDTDQEMSTDGGITDGGGDALFIGQALEPGATADDDDEFVQVDLRAGKADDGRSGVEDDVEPSVEGFGRSDELSGGAGMGCNVSTGGTDWSLLLFLLALAPIRRRH